MKRIFVGLMVLGSTVMAQPSAAPLGPAPATTEPAFVEKGDRHTTSTGLIIIDVAKGDPGAKAGDLVWVHYTGRLADGSTFDTSRASDRGPFRFKLGAGHVIKGWDEGITGMKVGEKRQLIIPPALAYKEAGSPPKIGPNATLYFDVELIGIARMP